VEDIDNETESIWKEDNERRIYNNNNNNANITEKMKTWGRYEDMKKAWHEWRNEYEITIETEGE